MTLIVIDYPIYYNRGVEQCGARWAHNLEMLVQIHPSRLFYCFERCMNMKYYYPKKRLSKDDIQEFVFNFDNDKNAAYLTVFTEFGIV